MRSRVMYIVSRPITTLSVIEQAFKSSNKKDNYEPRSIFTPSSRLTHRNSRLKKRRCTQDGCFAEHLTGPKVRKHNHTGFHHYFIAGIRYSASGSPRLLEHSRTRTKCSSRLNKAAGTRTVIIDAAFCEAKTLDQKVGHKRRKNRSSCSMRSCRSTSSNDWNIEESPRTRRTVVRHRIICITRPREPG